MVVELWCDTLFFQGKVLVAWESVHWGPDFWVSEDVDVKTTQAESHAANQPQITVQPQSSDLSFVDSVLDVSVLVLVKSETKGLSKRILSVTTIEFQFILSLN